MKRKSYNVLSSSQKKHNTYMDQHRHSHLSSYEHMHLISQVEELQVLMNYWLMGSGPLKKH